MPVQRISENRVLFMDRVNASIEILTSMKVKFAVDVERNKNQTKGPINRDFVLRIPQIVPKQNGSTI